MHQTCTGTKKTQVLNFKVRQTCTGTKKTKVLNFKVRQTCTGTKKTKKNKNFTIYLGRGDYPSKVFVFFVFLSLCRFGELWSSKLLFFLSLCRFGALWSSKHVFFLSLCRFGALWSSKPNAFVHLYFDIVSIACRYSRRIRIWHFLLPMQFFEGSGAFFMQRVYNLKINLSLFRTRFWFQEIGVFLLLKCQCIYKVICIQDAFFTGICSVFEHVIILII